MRKIIFLFCFLCQFLSAQYSISTIERNALIAIYNKTNGENWAVKWDLSLDPKLWTGVVIKNKTVSELHLNGFAMRGNFPTEITQFSKLKKLDVGNNLLTGSVPSLSNLSQLTYLNLSKNDFEGDPYFIYSGLSSLEEIYLGENSFTLSNTDFSSFQNIKTLDLSGCNLSQIPSSLSALPNLESLTISKNPIVSYSLISAIPKLKELYISENNLSEIPLEVKNVVGLKVLDASKNSISDFPTSGFTNLEWLSLESNTLSFVPSGLASLKNLVHLNLGRNQITSSFSAIENLPKLEQLWLNNNLIVGGFPTELLSIKSLQMLCLNSNQLTGTLPNNLPPITQISNNRYNSSEIEAYLSQNSAKIELVYSPQRYDEQVIVKAPLGSSVQLNQSLSGSEYEFSWYKNYDENLSSTSSNYMISNVVPEDYTYYTCESYLSKTALSDFFEASFYRESIELKEGIIMGTDESILKNLSIYPNPTSDYIEIKNHNYKIESVFIYDLSGKMLLKSLQPKINVKHFASGTYIITLKTQEGFRSFKFIKQ